MWAPQVGHERTLRNDPIWARWLDWAHSKNLQAMPDSILPPGWQQTLQVVQNTPWIPFWEKRFGKLLGHFLQLFRTFSHFLLESDP